MNGSAVAALLPVIALIGTGFGLARVGLVRQAAVKDMSNLVFLLLLPSLLFRTMAGVHVQELDFGPIAVYFGGVALVFGAIHYYDAKGRRVELPALERGQSHFNAREKFTLTHHEDGSYTLEATDGLRQQFAAQLATTPSDYRRTFHALVD